MENIDHFDIVENLSKADFFITKKIIDDAKLFAKGDSWKMIQRIASPRFVHIQISCNIFTSFQLKNISMTEQKKKAGIIQKEKNK